MVVERSILARLTRGFPGAHIEVYNESHGHRVPAGSETHFRVVVVSDIFEKATKVSRHRQINQLLAEELAGPVHALAIEAYAPAQWAQREGARRDAPPCKGGSAHEGKARQTAAEAMPLDEGGS